MKILFVAELSHVRHYTLALEELRRRGHEVVLANEHRFDNDTKKKSKKSTLGYRYHAVNLNARDKWQGVANSLRWTRNQIFFCDPRYETCTKLRKRYAHLTDPLFADRLERKDPADLAQLDGFLKRLDDSLPLQRSLLKFLRKVKPDMLLITPLIFQVHMHQYDFIRCAKSLGIPTCYPVFSWDNLSTKGALLHEPDLTIVWNDVQKEELTDWHHLPAEKVAVCGAYRFEEFLKYRVSKSREQYFKELGLDPAKKTLLYIGSSGLCAPGEGKFTSQWVAAVRGSRHKELRETNIVVRPHPLNAESFDPNDKTFERVVYTVPNGMTGDDLQDLYDALTYSDGVIGINTSAMLEAATLKKPIFTITTEVTEPWQKGTIHFEYVAKSFGGAMHLASSFEDHLELLQEYGMEGNPSGDARSEHFASKFLGLWEEKSSSARFVDALEKLAVNFQPAKEKGWLPKRVVDFVTRHYVLTVMPIRRDAHKKGTMVKLKQDHKNRLAEA